MNCIKHIDINQEYTEYMNVKVVNSYNASSVISSKYYNVLATDGAKEISRHL